MKILIIGGTGVLGRSFCKLAQHKKYRITALSRSPERSTELRRFGVEVLQGSILDADSIRAALDGHDVVLNFASAIPKKLKPSSDDWETNDRVRTEGTSHLLSALTGAEVFYCQAGLAYVYGDRRGEWVDESSPVQPNRFTASSRVMEELFLNSGNAGLKGVSFRFGLFYHQDAWHTQTILHEIRKRRFPVLGDGEYFWNMIHVDDAAAAVFHVLQQRHQIQERQILNATDEAPVLCREFLDHLARLQEVHEPTRIPLFVARLALGSEIVDGVTASFRCRNERLQSMGWKPTFRSFREGFPAVLQYI